MHPVAVRASLDRTSIDGGQTVRMKIQTLEVRSDLKQFSSICKYVSSLYDRTCSFMTFLVALLKGFGFIGFTSICTQPLYVTFQDDTMAIQADTMTRQSLAHYPAAVGNLAKFKIKDSSSQI
jgi:hypothetical protein